MKTPAPPRPELARTLTDARLQFHHAAQFASALGISYLAPQLDDSHTNLGWDESLGAVVSRPAEGADGPVALGVRAADLAVLALGDGGEPRATIPLQGLTLAGATDAIRSVLATGGLDSGRYTRRRHFEIPHHAVDDGAGFDTTRREAFRELAAWYSVASMALEEAAGRTPEASTVRIWPHHFDIATLVTIGPGRSSGAGLSPGDEYYDEPYFYVNAYPAPAASRLTAPLDGGGRWHTLEWIGAVLPGSRLTSDPAGQQAQVRAFLRSAMAACQALARG